MASWKHLEEAIALPGDSNFSLAGARIPGISSVSRDQLEDVRTVFAQVAYLCRLVAAFHKDVGKSTFVSVCRDARMVLMRTAMSEDEAPFRVLERKGSPSEFEFAMSEERALTCDVAWGPMPGLVRNLLSPAAMVLAVWLNGPTAVPLLDLQYAFAASFEEFTVAWLECPVKADSVSASFPAIQTRANKLIASAAVSSPGLALVTLASRAKETLGRVIHAVYHAFRARGFHKEAVSAAPGTVHISEVVQSELLQYTDCTITAVSQVQSVLPTMPSFPDITPNFEDDPSANWHRTAQYVFENVKIPAASALRGDPLSELRWHRFQCDALHARADAVKLSERQVIRHLFSSCSRAQPHYTIAQETLSRQFCTLREWLDTIRDFYFTSGQFRHNIERAWQQYSAADAVDFNELIHHIKTYYQLIFLDYVHMPGKQTKLEFAWILFTKLQALLQPGTTSVLTPVLIMFMPLSTLLERMNTELTPALRESSETGAVVAESFIIWVITQLQSVRESANTARRFTTELPTPNIDFALMGGQNVRNKHTDKHTDKPRLQAAAVTDIHGHPHVTKGQGYPGPPPNRSNHMQYEDREGHVPGLKEAANSTDEAAVRAWVTDYVKSPGIDPALKKALELELAGGPTSIHGALSQATEVPQHLGAAGFRAVTQLILRVYHLYPGKQCSICPLGRKGGKRAPLHPLSECPNWRRILPKSVADAFFAEPFNQHRAYTPLPPKQQQQQQQQPKDKRPRYDTDRAGNQSKRPRPFDQPIR